MKRTEILSFIRQEKIAGVLFVSGDFHFPMFARIGASPQDLGYELFEVLAGKRRVNEKKKNKNDNMCNFVLTIFSWIGPGGSSINLLAKYNFVLQLPSRQLIRVLDTWSYTRFTAHPVFLF